MTTNAQHLLALREAWESAYDSACEYDGIVVPEGASFSVFSKENPFGALTDKAAKRYMEARHGQ